jgi:hypothetical protein
MNFLAMVTLSITCNFVYNTLPFAALSFTDTDGTLSPTVSINYYGATHPQSLTAAPIAPGEFVHAWITKEDPDNAIEFIIYDQEQANGRAVMNYSQVPGGQIWGECTGLN